MKKAKIIIAITCLLAALVSQAQTQFTYPIIFNNTVQFNKERADVNATRLSGISAPVGVGGNYLTYVTIGSGLSLSNDVLSVSGAPTGNVWSITGNSISGGGSFLGLTNNRSLNFRTNNTQRMRLDSLGRLGIGRNPQTLLDVAGGFRDSSVVSGYEYHANVGYSNRFTLNHAYYTLRLADSLVYGMFLDNSINGKVIVAWQDAGAANAEEWALMAYSTGIRIGYNINNTTFVRGLTVENTLGTVISGEVAGTGYNTVWQDSTGTAFAAFRNRRLGVGTDNPTAKLHVVGSELHNVTGQSYTITGLPAYADDAAAGVGGLTAGMLYQTTGAGAAPLNAAGIIMIKQ